MLNSRRGGDNAVCIFLPLLELREEVLDPAHRQYVEWTEDGESEADDRHSQEDLGGAFKAPEPRTGLWFGVGHGETPGLVPGCYQRILHVGADPLDGGTRAVGRDLEDIAGRVSDTEANHLWRVVGPLVDDAET